MDTWLDLLFKILASINGVKLPPAEKPDVPDEPDDPEIDGALLHLNRRRTNKGLKALKFSACFYEQALAKCKEMAETGELNHEGASRRRSNCGYSYGGENVLTGTTDPKQAIKWWQRSSDHKKIQMSGLWDVCGIANHDGYWCAIFSTESKLT